MSYRAWLVSLPLALLGCTDLDAKGPEQGMPVDGKLDSAASPTDHGVLTFGELDAATLSADEAHHVWSFTLSDDAEVEGFTDGDDPIDTVLYLYKHSARGWGAYVERNDEDGRGSWSSIKRELSAGEYRFLVKGYDTDAVGAFSFAANCEGAGCEQPVQACAFGTSLSALLDSSDWTVMLSLDATEASDFHGTSRLAALAALQVTFPELADLEEIDGAMARVDGGAMRLDELQHVRLPYAADVISYRVNGKLYGAVFKSGTADKLAEISSGSIVDCVFSL
jgi:hypothetical protein